MLELKKLKVKELKVIAKMLQIKNISKMKKNDLINSIIEEFNNRSQNELVGMGFISDIKNKVVSGLQKVKTFFNPYANYRPQAQKIIAKYKDMGIKEIYAFRKPVMAVLNTILNAISLGKFEEAKKKSNYDNLFHLGLIIVLDDETHIVVEKNERIDMELIKKENMKNWGELKPVEITNEITFGELLENAQKGMGANYFKYSPFGNNCQVYAQSVLKYSDLLDEETNNFIYQPLESIVEMIPKSTATIAKAVTTLGGFFANLKSKVTGKGQKKTKNIN
jgi:hypothetical protein